MYRARSRSIQLKLSLLALLYAVVIAAAAACAGSTATAGNCPDANGVMLLAHVSCVPNAIVQATLSGLAEPFGAFVAVRSFACGNCGKDLHFNRSFACCPDQVSVLPPGALAGSGGALTYVRFVVPAASHFVLCAVTHLLCRYGHPVVRCGWHHDFRGMP